MQHDIVIDLVIRSSSHVKGHRRGCVCVLLILLVILSLLYFTQIILTVIYIRIWLELRQRRRMVIGDQLSGSRHSANTSVTNGQQNLTNNPDIINNQDDTPAKRFRMR